MGVLKEITRKNFMFHYAEDNSPARTYAKHCHFLYEAYLLIEGEINYVIAGETFTLKSGNMLLIPPAVFHRAEITAADKPYRRAVMIFAPPAGFSDKKRPLLYRENAEIRALFDRLLSYADRLDGNELDAIAAAYPAELMILLNHVSPVETLEPVDEADMPSVVRKAVAYINDRLAEDFTLDDVAKAADVSKHYICHAFGKTVGEGVMEYARHRKLEEARLLIEAGIRPGKAAAKMGFDNYTTFYRAYKRFYGQAPRPLRDE